MQTERISGECVLAAAASVSTVPIAAHPSSQAVIPVGSVLGLVNLVRLHPSRGSRLTARVA